MDAGVPTLSAGESQQPAPQDCFLCAYSDHGCDVPYIEGTLLTVAERYGQGKYPAALLATSDGEYALVLPEHTKAFIARLATLPNDTLRTLHLRVFHLMRTPENPTQPLAPAASRRTRLHATPASAIVLEPDLLLNITDINNAEYCVRQYPLRRMIPSAPTPATLRGTIIHSAFKELLKGGADTLDSYLGRAIEDHITDLALRQIDIAQISADAEPHLRALASWHDRQRQRLWGDTTEVRAETFLLAPEVGLKGRLDFLMHDAQGDSLLELKTSTVRSDLPKREHRWQVYGYQTLLAARHPHDSERPGANLLYSGTPGEAEHYRVPFALRELHRVLDLRNALALTHATGSVPPPPSPAKCAKCVLRADCLRASPLLGWEPPESDEQPAPTSPEDATEFAETYDLLRLEARASETQATALWQLSAEDRCAAGIALGGLTLADEPRQMANGQWEYSFRCENTSELREGDEILLSDGDPVRGAAVSGSILRLDEHGVTVWAPERIAHPALIDRYASDIVHNRTVRNLWRWLGADPYLRALVAGRQQPTFDTPAPALPNLPSSFNAEQRLAVERALAARDFLLIQGPPGTGKTGVVAEIARHAVARGERVLIAAFTNQAVDNVLKRLIASDMRDFVRLGHQPSVAPELHPYRLAARVQARANPTCDERDAASEAASVTPERVRQALHTAPLVATTTATWSAERYDDAGEPLHFDLAIVDEASQITIPALLGALRFARRFVLVGDEHQLPPLVVSEEAAARGLRHSLFTRLLDHWGETASVALREQYRMHPLICAFPSREFYGDQLIAAGTARTATLDLTLPDGDPLAPVLTPERPVVFVNVEEHIATESKASAAQAEVVRKLVLALRNAGLPAEHIGVIAPYRAQVAAIRQRLAAKDERDVMVDTVDRFQGGERQVIVFSFGGRLAPGLYGRGTEFLADPHRLNVALTRAQRKLILVGDRRWLSEIPVIARLIRSCQELYNGHGGIVNARLS